MNSTHYRFDLLSAWLKECQYLGKIEAIAGDASGRKFYRLYLEPCNAKRPSTVIAVDAPPPQEQIKEVQQALRFFSNSEYCTFPKLYRLDAVQGFALMEDFGDELLIKHLPQQEKALYQQGLLGLVAIQQMIADKPAPYPKELLESEMKLFTDWLLRDYLKVPSYHESAWAELREQLIQAIQRHPQTTVHRDFHSRNLLCYQNRLGVVDFQDAVLGSYVYDSVSLLRDAYYESQNIEQYLSYFHQASPIAKQYSFSEFQQHFYTVCVQRQLKVAGIFARLHLRDGKDAYLPYIPRVLDYLMDAISQIESAKWLMPLVVETKASLIRLHMAQGISCKP